ncbi:MAG: hypothetical protein FGM46_02360 [Ferruginibacter sp.]|nr:hypothetical protein [Ferruginibacter sp.]
MKKNILGVLLFVSIFVVIIFLRNRSENDLKELQTKIETEIKSVFQKKSQFQNNPRYNYVRSFRLHDHRFKIFGIRFGNENYTGTLNGSEGGVSFNYDVKVTKDGESYKWEIVK